jgi:hypothetical protein
LPAVVIDRFIHGFYSQALSMISDRVEKGCSLPVGYHYQTTLAYFYAVLGRREVLGELLSSIAGRNDLPPAMERMAVWMKASINAFIHSFFDVLVLVGSDENGVGRR